MTTEDHKRKSWYEDEEEEDAIPAPSGPGGKPGVVAPGSARAGAGPISSVAAAMECDAIQSLMEQVHQLYGQYFSGLERRPPNEKHAMLDKRLKALQAGNQPEHLKFRLGALKTQYATYRDLWERKLREKETGRG